MTLVRRFWRLVRYLVNDGYDCPGCGARPMTPHRRQDCPQRYGVDLWA